MELKDYDAASADYTTAIDQLASSSNTEKDRAGLHVERLLSYMMANKDSEKVKDEMESILRLDRELFVRLLVTLLEIPAFMQAFLERDSRFRDQLLSSFERDGVKADAVGLEGAAKSTIEFWYGMLNVDTRINIRVLRLGTPAASPDGATRRCKEVAEILERATREIASLPVAGVEDEAVSQAQQIVSLYSDGAALLRGAAAFGEELARFVRSRSARDVAIEAFLRGLLGDPLGTYEELRDHVEQFEQTQNALKRRAAAYRAFASNVTAKELSVRAALGKRCGREIPTIPASIPAAICRAIP